MKRFAVVSALVAAVMITGCASRQLDSSETIGYAPAYGTEIAPEYGAVTEEQNVPPALRLELKGAETASVVTLDTGTFCWEGLCVDCISPIESYEQGFVRAYVDIGMLEDQPRVLLPEEAEIASVVRWGRNGEDIITEPASFSDDGRIILSLASETSCCVYDITVRFEGGNSCNYIFATERAPELQSSDTEPVQLSAPPQLKLFTATNETERSYTLNTGNYSWTIVDGDVASETLACGASPLQSAALGNAVTIPSAEELISSPRLMLPEGAEITRVNVWRSEDDFYEVEFTEDGKIILADSSMGCVYSVTVVFPQGCAEYVFAVEQLCGYPTVEDTKLLYDRDGLWHPKACISRTDDFDGWEGLIVVTEPDNRFTQYDEAFFADNALVVTTMTEGSGSVSHEFLGIDRDNVIHIGRNIPMIGTCDMAKYELVIEIPRALADVEFRTKYDDEREFDELSPMM